MHRVDIRTLNREGCLASKGEIIIGTLSWTNNNGSITIEAHEDHLYLKYTANKEYIEETVIISKRPCRFGGFQKYLICPGCDRRVVTLYDAGTATRPN